MKRFYILFLLLMSLKISPAIGETIDRSKAYSGKPLVVGFSTTSLDILRDENRKWLNSYIDFWSLMAQELKRPYVFKPLSFEDMIRALHEGTIDITATPLLVSAEREELFDLSTTLGGARIGVAKRYESWDYPWLSAIRIFLSWGAFRIIIALFTGLALLGSIIWLIERKDNPEHFGQGPAGGIGTGIYWAGSTLASGVCLGVNLKTATGRLLGLFWMVLCAVAFSAVIASLTYSLSAQGHTAQPLESDQIKKMRIGIFKGSTQERILEGMGVRYIQCDNTDHCIKDLLAKKTDGFMYDEGYLHYLSETRYRGIVTVYPTDLKPYRRAFAMPKNSALRKPFNIALLKILDRPVGEALIKQLDLSAYIRARPPAQSEEMKGRRPGRRKN